MINLWSGEFDSARLAAMRDRLRGQIAQTPAIESPTLNEAVGGRVLVKFENMQITGAFKFRGALNWLHHLSSEDRQRGVVTSSSGNQALGVSAAAALLGVRSVVIMPPDAPRPKIDAALSLGAEIIIHPDARSRHAAVAREIATARGMVAFSSYEDPLVIAGQSSLAMELIEQAASIQFPLESVLVPCGGGSLAAGCAVALASNGVSVVCVEPVEFDNMAQSLTAGRPIATPAERSTICDALRVVEPGTLTFTICRDAKVGAVAVTDLEVVEALRFARAHFKVLLEPGGAVALAAVLAGRVASENRSLAVVCSGGNIDLQTFERLTKQ